MVDKPAFEMGDHVEKISGSSWRGRVVGTYSTDLTREGYAVESDTEKGSVQIYPAKALRLVTPANGEQVERVARAIYEEDDPWHKAWAWPDLSPEAQGGATAADRYRDIARAAIAAMDPTPTEDARERVKVLEKALEPFLRVAEPILHNDRERWNPDQWFQRLKSLNVGKFRALHEAARTALGNKETDRHG